MARATFHDSGGTFARELADFARCLRASRWARRMKMSRSAWAEAVAKMGLRYAVGDFREPRRPSRRRARTFFARTIEEIRRRVPGCKVEVLIPDFSRAIGMR